MGRMQNYARVDDFTSEAKKNGINEIFFNMVSNIQPIKLNGSDGKQYDGKITSMILFLSAISMDGKLYLTMREDAGSFTTTPATKPEEIDEFQRQMKSFLDGKIAEIQKEYSNMNNAVVLKSGECHPTDA